MLADMRGWVSELRGWRVSSSSHVLRVGVAAVGIAAFIRWQVQAQRAAAAEQQALQQTLNTLTHAIVALTHATTDLTQTMVNKPEVSNTRGRSATRRARTVSEYEDSEDEFHETISELGSPVSREAISYSNSAEDAKQTFFAEVDALYASDQQTESMEVFEARMGAHTPCAGVLWRHARALVTKAKVLPLSKEALLKQAVECARNALDLSPNTHEAHKWFAVASGSTAEYLPIKEQIQVGFKFKEHVLRAIELCPTDAVCYFLIGHWCFRVAAMTWFQRQAASKLFGEPPSATYDETLNYFLKAESLRQDGWKSNLLMIAKTYEKLGNKAQYGEYLQRASTTPPRSRDDHEAQVEIKQLLGH